MAQLRFTPHAEQRLVERNLAADEVMYVVLYGQRIRNAGVWMYFLSKCDIPVQDRADQRIAQLVNTAVLVDDGWVMTVYRSAQALKKHRRKRKWRRGDDADCTLAYLL